MTKLAEVESAAKAVVECYRSLEGLIKQQTMLRNQFVETAKEFQTEFQIVRDYFAHKPQSELFLGKYRTGEEWCRGELNISYRHFCRCTPKPSPIPTLLPKLPDDEPNAAHDAAPQGLQESQDDESQDTKMENEIAARLTKLFTNASALVLPTQKPDLFNVTFCNLTKDKIKKIAEVLKDQTDTRPFGKGKSQ